MVLVLIKMVLELGNISVKKYLYQPFQHLLLVLELSSVDHGNLIPEEAIEEVEMRSHD